MTLRRRDLTQPLLSLVLLSLVSLLSLGAARAWGETAAPGWQIISTTSPTNLSPGGKGAILVQPFNVGAAASVGTIEIEDVLPPGVTATDAGGTEGAGGQGAWEPEVEINHELWQCAIAPGEEENSVVTCHNGAVLPSIPGGAGLPSPASPGYNMQPPVLIAVEVAPSAAEGLESNRMHIEGGGASGPASSSDPVTISSETPPFGFARWDGWLSNADGTLDMRAGSVPYAAGFTFDLNAVIGEKEIDPAGGEARNYNVALPPGFVGNPQATVQCTRVQFDAEACPRASAIGVVEPITGLGIDLHRLLFNVVAPPGSPAEFGFTYEGIDVFLVSKVRSGTDYGVTTQVTNAPQRIVTSVLVTIWGVPGDPTHNVWRCGNTNGCKLGDGENNTLGPHPSLKPLLRVPTSCAGIDSFSDSADNWFDEAADFTEPVYFSEHNAQGQAVSFSECKKLPFAPGLESKATTGAADSPAGVHFDLHVPQPETVQALEEEVGGEKITVGAEPALHEADLRDAKVTFPAGMAIDPSAADGLVGCSETQIGFTGFSELDKTAEPGVRTPQFSPTPAECPDASKIGTVEVDTPLVNHPLPGAVYLAKQSENPFGSLFALYISIYDPVSGVVVKAPGLVEADAATGQVSASFAQNPQVPFEDLKIDIFGGSRAAFTTPPTCGGYTTTSALTPWSSPAQLSPTASFEVTEAPGGGGCAATVAQEPNAPTLSAGTFTPLAGAYSPLVLRLSREDGSQRIGALSMTLPEGLIGKLAGVEQCSQADIEAAEHRGGEGQGHVEQESPSCPAGSLVGIAHVGVGSGTPLYVSARAYLAGPYKGGPYSIVVITPAVAGPFDLGVVVVRAALHIDPLTTQVTVTSDPLPSIRDGIPFDIRSINVEVNRNDFTLNPTSCEKTQITGTITAEASQAPVSAPFQVGGCTGLPFKPSFTVATSAKTSRANGASLEATIEIPPATPGSDQATSQANTRSVKVELPAQLPSRLVTLQKACLAQVFEANPATCPAASAVGHARAVTPLLPVALEGPAYFVSYGNAKWPELVLVLQGYGITVDVHGETFISKAGVTSTTFHRVPDVPYTSFTLTLPEGPYSALTANGNLCQAKLVMPTIFVGQNGADFKQQTQIAVTGCAKSQLEKAKKLTRAQKLAKALKACRKDKSKHKRAKCDAQARRRYGPVKKTNRRTKGKSKRR